MKEGQDAAMLGSIKSSYAHLWPLYGSNIKDFQPQSDSSLFFFFLPVITSTTANQVDVFIDLRNIQSKYNCNAITTLLHQKCAT